MEFLEENGQENNNSNHQLNRSNSFKKKRKVSFEGFVPKTKSHSIGVKDLKAPNPDENYKKVMEAVQEGFELTSPATSVKKVHIPEFMLEDDEGNKSFIIGVVGGASSGKTIMAYTLKKVLEDEGWTVCVLKEKHFLKPISIEDDGDRNNFIKNYDFDSKEAIDYENFRFAIKQLSQGRPFNTPIYNYFTKKREKDTKKLSPGQVLIIEGRLLLTDKEVKDTLNLSIYLDTDLDILLSRRVLKQITIGLDVMSITDRFLKFVKPAHEKLVEPSKEYADITLNNFHGKVEANDGKSAHPGTSSMIFQLIPGLIMFHQNKNGEEKIKENDDSEINDKIEDSLKKVVKENEEKSVENKEG